MTKLTQGELPLARATDPETSHEAAASVVDKLRESQRDVLRVFSQFHALTDEELIGQFGWLVAFGGKPQSPSGIRTRRKELVVAGKIALFDYTTNANGRRVQRWRAL